MATVTEVMPNWTNPSVTEQLLFSTVRLERRRADGEAIGAGTGFLLRKQSVHSDEVYLITNRHVLQGAHTVVGYFTRRDSAGAPDIGNVFFVDLSTNMDWRSHPDPQVDLCATAMGRRFLTLLNSVNASAYYIAPSMTMLADASYLGQLDPFMEVMLVGYPNGIFDSHNYMPLLRQGVTASHPALDFANRPEFLIDAAVFPGSSGSPVLSYSRSIKGPIVDFRVLGVLRAVRYATEKGDFTMIDVPSAMTPVVTYDRPLNLGTVIKGPVIQAFLQKFDAAPQLLVATA